ncbi:hypothetical protein JZ751_003371 [Albula glossodonta]|uniref:NAD(P)(+)--arginine ADP-ribosyltransferase n=1 Tax=Albula glossodonta TaxID=121402 RepID=A0A8T2NE50_9TELE|nr:hypothetical protein JZ751_003371 [Albula glossodonta]
MGSLTAGGITLLLITAIIHIVDSAVKMDMSPSAVDDQFLKCRERMLQKVLGGLLQQELRANIKFQQAWGNTVCEHPIPKGTVQHTKALAMYTHETKGFSTEFDTAVQSQGGNARSYEGFPFKALHFLLTDALRLLGGKGCGTVCHHSDDLYEVSEGAEVRFGTFMAAIHSCDDSDTPDKGTLFEITSCTAVQVDNHACDPEEVEMLIQPFEVFKVLEMEPASLPAVSRMALCGGTHGNELSGVYLVREWQKKKRELEGEAEPITVMTLISNPRAVQHTLVSDGVPYEIARAQELNALLGPRGSDGAVDLICDLHNTTANMGLCLITNSDCDWICLHIYKYIQARISDPRTTKLSSMPVRLLNLNAPPDQNYFLASVGKHALSIEIGPQPHGLVRADILSTMKEGVHLMIEWLRLFNSGTEFEGGIVEVYSFLKNIDFPRDPETHDITAIIHPQLQDQDFCLLKPGDPIFLSFSGESVVYEGGEPLYPVFVNESSYYEKGTAFTLTRMKKVEIPPLRLKRD